MSICLMRMRKGALVIDSESPCGSLWSVAVEGVAEVRHP